MFRFLGILTAAALLSACASHKLVTNHPPIKRIAIIPASNPTDYSFENAAALLAPPPVWWVNKFDSKSKAKTFKEYMRAHPEQLGNELTEKVATSLRERGFSVEVLAGLSRPADDPDNVDYDKISSDADAILHVWISEVGLYSSTTSIDYIPRVNAGAKLFIKGQEDNIYSEDIYYGVDARKGKQWAIVPDAKYAFRSFDLVMSNIDEVRSAFATGAAQIGERMSDQIYRATKN